MGAGEDQAKGILMPVSHDPWRSYEPVLCTRTIYQRPDFADDWPRRARIKWRIWQRWFIQGINVPVWDWEPTYSKNNDFDIIDIWNPDARQP